MKRLCAQIITKKSDFPFALLYASSNISSSNVAIKACLGPSNVATSLRQLPDSSKKICPRSCSHPSTAAMKRFLHTGLGWVPCYSMDRLLGLAGSLDRTETRTPFGCNPFMPRGEARPVLGSACPFGETALSSSSEMPSSPLTCGG